MAFWDSWELWMKFCFILGIAIVVVVLLGLGKLSYDRYKLRKFTKVATAQGDDAPQMQQRRRSRRGASDIPFGVRAIESGVEVEGVWISRPTSANTSPKQSRTASPHQSPESLPSDKGKAPMRTSNIPSINMPAPAYAESSRSSHSSRQESSSTDHQFERATGAERIPSSRSSRNVSPNSSQRTSRPSYKPRQSSALRFTSFHPEEEYHAEGSEESNGSIPDGSFSVSSNDSEQSPKAPRNPASQPAYYRPKRQSAQSDHSTSALPYIQPRRSEVEDMPFQLRSGVDLSYLSPRRSMAAESGLLPSKSRGSSNDGSARASPQPIAETDETPVASPARRRDTDPFENPSSQSYSASGPSARGRDR